MMGDRYGEVVRLYRAHDTDMAKVKMDKSGGVCQFPLDELKEI